MPLPFLGAAGIVPPAQTLVGLEGSTGCRSRRNVAMNRKATNADQECLPRPTLAVLSTEALRQSEAANAASSKPEEKISVFWRVFGGTLLSIAALVLLTVYQGISSNINELRNDLTHVRELQVDMVKKDEFNTRTTTMWSSVKENFNDVPALKTRATLLESQLKTADQERKDLAHEVQALRERMAALEGRQAAPKPTPERVDGHIE
jgi:hypothetical protein